MSAASPVVPGARHTVVPAGIVATSWPKVSQTCRNIGWRFDPWQDAAGRLILAKRDGGRWAADLSILSIPRQVGKSYLLGCIIFALCLLNPRLRVIWTSHHTATTEEMYEAMKDLAQHRRVAPHVTKCIALQGSRWRIQFRNGSRIDFGARSQGFGRGKARVGVLVLDEFQHISARALANLAPTTNTADNPLILCAGTPPGPNANGEAFAMRRKAAIEGLSDDTLYVEFSADADADLDDRKQWTRANPSFPKRTKERAFLLLRKILEEDDFRREALGVWKTDSLAGGIPTADWEACADPLSEIVGTPVLVVSLAPDQSAVSLVAAGKRRDGKTHVEVIRHGAPGQWFIDDVAAISRRQSATVRLHPGHPAGGLLPDLTAAGVPTEMLTSADYTAGCGAFYGAVIAGTLRYRPPQPELNEAIAKASQKRSGETWKWAGEGISALVAATQAVWAVNNTTPGGWAVSL